jgi:hypothetical protein
MKGGKARAAALTDEKRTENTRKAAEARIKRQAPNSVKKLHGIPAARVVRLPTFRTA